MSSSLFLFDAAGEQFDLEETRNILSSVPGITKSEIAADFPYGKKTVFGDFYVDGHRYELQVQSKRYNCFSIPYAGTAAVRLAIDIAHEFQKRRKMTFRLSDIHNEFDQFITPSTDLAGLLKSMKERPFAARDE